MKIACNLLLYRTLEAQRVNRPHNWDHVWTDPILGVRFERGTHFNKVWKVPTVRARCEQAAQCSLVWTELSRFSSAREEGGGGGRGPEEAAAAAAELMRSFCRGVWCSAWCHNVFNVGDMTRWVLLLQLQYPHWLLSIFFIKITQNHCRFCRWPISGGIGSCWAAETASRGHVVAFESLICVDKKATSSRVNQPRSSFRCSHGHGGNVFVCLPSGCDHGGLKLSFTTLQKPLTD